MTDVQKYNRIVESPLVVKIREFDKNRYSGLGRTVAFIDGSYENLAAFISKNKDSYILCDKAGNPMIFAKNHSFKGATNYKNYPHGEEVLNGLKSLTNEDGRWVRDFVEEPIMLSYSRYYQIYSAAEEISIKPWTVVPEDVLDQVKDVMLPSGLPTLDDEDFSLLSVRR